MSVYLSFGILVLIVGVGHGYQFPGDFLKCGLDQEDLDQCLIKAMEIIFHQYGKTGIPSLNLPSIDPIEIPKMEIGAGTGAVNLVQRYQKARIFGLSDSKIVRVHYDQNNKILNFTADYPELRQEAKYNMSGKVMMLSVHGFGDSILRLKEPTIVHVATFKEKTKMGKKHLHIEDYSLRFTIKGARYDFKNMFDGDEKLSGVVSKVLNDNWNVIFEDVRDGYEQTYGLVCKAIANQFFDTVPMEDIFLK
ncbi:unnamed protein product [Phaedon cochleariae]|uniref:Uncharacterized protein n=1 Tax=Phaedon cochleariae TaxID=80249 RepID=A0A9P0DKE4_PHACE|nr:unnamed protein product [Phaedon cochleariae]